MLKSYHLLKQAKGYHSEEGEFVYNFIIRTSDDECSKVVYLTLDLTTDPGSLKEGVNSKPDAIILVTDEDLYKIGHGKMNVDYALKIRRVKMQGKIQAMKYIRNLLFKAKPKL